GKVTKAFLRASSRVVENWYDGLGRVVASSWQSTISGDLNVDQFRTDPYGNIAWSRKHDGFGNAPEYENHYDPYGRITLVQLAPTSPNPSTWSHEWREYDAAGNVSFAAEVNRPDFLGDLLTRVAPVPAQLPSGASRPPHTRPGKYTQSTR